MTSALLLKTVFLIILVSLFPRGLPRETWGPQGLLSLIILIFTVLFHPHGLPRSPWGPLAFLGLMEMIPIWRRHRGSPRDPGEARAAQLITTVVLRFLNTTPLGPGVIGCNAVGCYDSFDLVLSPGAPKGSPGTLGEWCDSRVPDFKRNPTDNDSADFPSQIFLRGSQASKLAPEVLTLEKFSGLIMI